jgi:ribosomal protein L7/L12
MDETTRLRIQGLEAQVRRISDHLGIPYDDPAVGIPSDVVALVRQGKTIHAIKLYREITGCDLAEAKSVVERI